MAFLIKVNSVQPVSYLDWHSQNIGFLESFARVVHTKQTEHHAEEDDEDIPAHGVPGHQVPPQIEVEDAGPDKREETSGKVSNEAHENGEVWNEDRKDDRDHNNPNPVSKTPDLQLSIQRPD